jgi:hypothetical protein
MILFVLVLGKASGNGNNVGEIAKVFAKKIASVNAT